GGDGYSRVERSARLSRFPTFPLQSIFRRATTYFLLTACGSETSLTPRRGCHDKLVCPSVVFPPLPPETPPSRASSPPAGTTRRSPGSGCSHRDDPHRRIGPAIQRDRPPIAAWIDHLHQQSGRLQHGRDQ